MTPIKRAMAAIAENATLPGQSLFIYNADGVPKKKLREIEKWAGVDSAVIISGPPHHSISAKSTAFQEALDTAKTEWAVIVDAAEIRPEDHPDAATKDRTRETAWMAEAGFIVLRTLPVRQALMQCPESLVLQFLHERGWLVFDPAFKPEPRISVLTLMGSAHRVEPWWGYLQKSDIPNSAKIIIADNSGDPECARLIASAGNNLRSQFRSVEIINLGRPYQRGPDEAYIHPGKHIHVADMYNQVLPSVLAQCDFVLFLEHDVIPPMDGFAKLMSLMQDAEKMPLIAAAAGVYEQPEHAHYVCAAKGKDRWTGIVEFANLPQEPFEVGMVGGGFTLYRARALEQCIPFRPTFWKDPYLLGWDGTLGRDLAALGRTIWLHPKCRCRHEYQPVHRLADGHGAAKK